MTNAEPVPLLSIEAVSRAYREGEQSRMVLNQVSLDVQAGDCIAILGRSGSGKSSLLNLISGIDRADSGEIRFQNKALSRLNDHQLTLLRRRHIGFIYQFFNLLPTLTVLENLLLPLELNRLPMDRGVSLLAEVGLAGRSNSFPDRLSGGEQQRLAIARALAHGPELVLADEPTGNLDRQTGEQVLALIDRLVRQTGKTLIIATHSKAVADRADRVYTLSDGRLIEAGSELAW